MLYKDLAYGIVLTAPSPATSGTSLVLNSGQGAYFPQPSTDGNFYITIFPINADPTFITAEICLVTARSTDTLTIVRTQKGTSARTVLVGDRVIQGIYASDIPAYPANATPTANNIPVLDANAALPSAALVGYDFLVMQVLT